MEKRMVHLEMLRQITSDMQILRREIHRYPEPGFAEIETARRIEQFLQKIPGLEVRTGIGKTGIVGVLGREKTGPCIALRADMDCLAIQEKNIFPHVSCRSGLMHACGHDGHVAWLVGAALLLGQMSEQVAGPVLFLFQPAEETCGGAVCVMNDGALKDPVPEAIFALHASPTLPLGVVATRNGAIMSASRDFTITIQGRGTHAAMPNLGDDLVLIASQIVCAAHTIVSRNISPLDSAVISIPRFIADASSNVMGDTVELQGTLRALSNETRSFLENRLAEVVKQCTATTDVSADIVFERGYPLLKNDERCVSHVVACAQQWLGGKNVIDDYPPSLGAEDFSFYLEEGIPGAFCWFGIGQSKDAAGNDIPLHHPLFDFNDAALESAIGFLSSLVLTEFSEKGYTHG